MTVSEGGVNEADLVHFRPSLRYNDLFYLRADD